MLWKATDHSKTYDYFCLPSTTFHLLAGNTIHVQNACSLK